MTLWLRPALVLCLLGSGAVAQPAPGALVAAWAEGQGGAARDVEAVVLTERVEREVEGPRRAMGVTFAGTVRYARGGRPERTVDAVTVDGRDASAEWGGAVRERLGQAFGPAGRDLAAPPPLPLAVLARAEPDGPAVADRVDGEAAWRVRLRPARRERGGRVEAWFSRADAPRLLRTRAERRHRGARLVREVDYARTAGLDLPRDVRTTATVRQRRRLRDYVVTVRSAGRYRVVRAERGGR